MFGHSEVVTFHRSSPCRPPDWRWRRACFLIAQGMYASSKRDDDLTCREVRFARQAAGYLTGRGLRILAKQKPDIFLAHQVHQEAGLRPLEIHGRVLARQSDRVIAATVGLPVPAVTAYTGLFFGVRDRIDARNYITFQVAGLNPIEPPTPETLMLLCSYFHGPGMVDPWLDYLQHRHESHDLATQVGRQREAIELLVAAHRLSDDEDVTKRLVKQLDVLVKLPQISKTRSVGAVVSANMTRMLGEIAWAQHSDEPFCSAPPARAGRREPRSVQSGKVA